MAIDTDNWQKTKELIILKLLDLPIHVELFVTSFGDFVFDFDTSGHFFDGYLLFRYNVSIRINPPQVIFHLYEIKTNTYLEIPLIELESLEQSNNT